MSAERLTLSPGQVKASPSTAGLTGAASWFWLDPGRQQEQLSVSLAGEAVTVTAVPRITWRFGDGASVDGGPGVPYQPGSVPADAITHVYEMRCLPGDQGHDPYVLQSCGRDGYQLTAIVAGRSAIAPLALSPPPAPCRPEPPPALTPTR